MPSNTMRDRVSLVNDDSPESGRGNVAPELQRTILPLSKFYELVDGPHHSARGVSKM